MNLPVILAAASQIGEEYEFLIPVAQTLDRAFLEHLVSDSQRIRLVPEALPALAHSRAGIIASGTATVEAAMMETPFVMVYRVTPLTYQLGRWTVKVPYFAMVNLIAGTKVVPELVQQDFTEKNVVAEISQILPESAARQKMLDGLRAVKSLLHSGNSGESTAARAAAAVMHEYCERPGSRV